MLPLKTMISFTSLKDKKNFLFKTDLVEQKDKVVTVCAHHRVILDRYEALQKYRCNPFKTHKKIIAEICN